MHCQIINKSEIPEFWTHMAQVQVITPSYVNRGSTCCYLGTRGLTFAYTSFVDAGWENKQIFHFPNLQAKTWWDNDAQER